MEATIIGSRILHYVWFAPDPNNPCFPTRPQVVETRFVRDITEFPENVNYVSFADVIETEVLVDGRPEKVYSDPFNKSGVYFVFYNKKQYNKKQREISGMYGHHEIEVHPTLRGKIWVFGNSRQLEAQKAE